MTSPHSFPLRLLDAASLQRRDLLRMGAVVLLLGTNEIALGASILAVRVWPAKDYTRLTIESDGVLNATQTLAYNPPRVVVDIATLTGACVIALGGVRSGMFASTDALAAELMQAGEAAQDLCWRMPLDDEYGESLKTHFADIANVGGRPAGAVTAAKYLQRFTEKYPWAHLDIAGTAWKGGAAKGATGRPVGLLLEFLLAQAGSDAKADAAKPSTARLAASKPRKT